MINKKDETLYELRKLSKQFGHPNVSQIIPINFNESSTQNIQNMLNKLRSYIALKKTDLQTLERYIEQLEQNFVLAVQYFDQQKQNANKFQNKLNDLNINLNENEITLKYRNDIYPMLDKIKNIYSND